MMQWNPAGDYPQIERTAYIHPAAVIIGKVSIGKGVFVGPQAVIRADEPGSCVVVSDNCNVQDRVVVHALANSRVEIGENVSLSHGCIVHGPCRIGRGCFIGFGSVVFNSRVAGGVFVGILALVSGVDVSRNRVVPDAAVINSQQKIKTLKARPEKLDRFARAVVKANLDLVKGYKMAVS